jgi:hypothetical protein
MEKILFSRIGGWGTNFRTVARLPLVKEERVDRLEYWILYHPSLTRAPLKWTVMIAEVKEPDPTEAPVMLVTYKGWPFVSDPRYPE